MYVYTHNFTKLILCSAYPRTRDLAESIQTKLDDYKAESKDLGRNQNVSELIILDRGFDVISPLLHELTYQVISCTIKEFDIGILYTGYGTGFAAYRK